MALPGKSPTDAQIDEAERRKAAGLPPWTWDQYLRRKRHVRFVEAFLFEWLRSRNVEVAAMRAARSVFRTGASALTDVGAKRKGFAMIKRPDVMQAVEKAFEEHGFSFADLVKLHIAHIKGEITRKRAIVVKDGKDQTHIEMVEEQLEPNYTALRDLEGLIIPKPAVKFEIDNVTKNRHVGGVIGGTETPDVATDDYPKLTARVVREDEDDDQEPQGQEGGHE